jgi:hypothetical protein
MQEIELEVLWHTDETKQLDDCGMDYDLEDVESRILVFYGISHLSINHWDDTHELTNIYSLSGEKYISKYSIQEVKEQIRKQIK